MKKQREYLLLMLDTLNLVLFYVLAIVIRYDFKVAEALAHPGFMQKLPWVALVFLGSFTILRTNKVLWEKISIEDGLNIVLSNLIGSLIIIILTVVSRKRAIPFSVIIIAFLLNTLFQEMQRFSYRFVRQESINGKKRNSKDIKRILIYGAGDSGALVARELSTNLKYKSYVVGFLDDNPYFKHKNIAGHFVFGGGDMIESVLRKYSIDEIIIAMPSQSEEIQKKVAAEIYKLGFPIRKIASTEVLFKEQNIEKSLKSVDITDILERKEVVISDDRVRSAVENQRILITGAAGSIGSELARQIIKNNPKSLELLDTNENGLYDLQQELKGSFDTTIISKFHVTSIRDAQAIDTVFKEGMFDLVFHAAAHKHVPLMENDPTQAVKNNIFGTHILIEAAKKFGIKKFVNISTDKAVNPTNVMGATKRFNEMVLQSQENAITKFMAVRFGNVLGSNGSVVPLFKKQIQSGGPVTVTHPDITRFFMTIPEAVSLILQTVTYAKGGEIFVLDMGEPVKIVDLAEKMITLMGFVPYRDIEIQFTGLRPGEKLYEELLMSEEGLLRTENDLIHIAKPIKTCEATMLGKIADLRLLIDADESSEAIVIGLKKAVPSFMSAKEYYKHV